MKNVSQYNISSYSDVSFLPEAFTLLRHVKTMVELEFRK